MTEEIKENLSLLPLEELPATDSKKEKEKVNCLGFILRELMYERKIEAVDIHKATGISYSTLSGWLLETVDTQLLDKNIFELSKFFNVSINYLGFGHGTDEPFTRLFEDTKEEVNNE